MAKLNDIRKQFSIRVDPELEHSDDCAAVRFAATMSGMLSQERVDALCSCRIPVKSVSAVETTGKFVLNRCLICGKDRDFCGHFVGGGAL